MSEIRESVQNFVEDLPLRISKAKEYVDIFRESHDLHQCSADLYGAILNTLDEVVQTYHKHVARKNRHPCGSVDGVTDSLQADLVPHFSNRNEVGKSFKTRSNMYKSAQTGLQSRRTFALCSIKNASSMEERT